MTLFVIPDRPHPEHFLARLNTIAGGAVLTYPSGRAWVVGDVTASVVAAPRAHAQRAVLRAGGAGAGSAHVTTSEAGVTSVRGTLSTTKHVFWARVEGFAVASDAQAPLRTLLGAPVDRRRLALALCGNLPSAPLRLMPFWQGVESVRPGDALVLGADGRVGTRRDWQVPDLDGIDLTDAAMLVRQVLYRTLDERVAGHARVSCDLSGGVDSTTLAYLLDARHGDVTYYHAATDDPANEDATWARIAGSQLRGPLVELPSFSTTTGAFTPALDGVDGALVEGPPAWGSNAGHLGALFGRLRSTGSSLHFNGLGGDEIFSTLPAAVLSVWRRDRRRGARALGRLRKRQRWPLTRTVCAVVSGTGYGQELRTRAAAPGGRPIDGPEEALSWAPGFSISPLATDAARAAVREEVLARVADACEPYFPDRARHQMLDAVVFQGEVTRQVNAAFGAARVSWDSPFLDESLVCAVLGMPPDISARGGTNKPLLARATEGVVPRWLYERRDKGEYSYDLFREYRARRDDVRALFADSYLVDVGLVDADRVRRALDAPLADVDQLFALEHVVGLERWVRSVA